MIRNVLLVFFVALFLGQCSCSVDSKISVNSDGKFVDKFGRIRMFHGFNAVNKGFPWYPSNLLNKTKLKLFKDWGFNAVRLGTMWAGAMPEKGKFNGTYMNITGGIIDSLASYGMYSLLDMHQDVISSKYHSYDGVPRWLIDLFPNATRKYPFPLPKPPAAGDWGLGYLTMAVGEAFEHLYRNESGAWQYWSQFWTEVAKQYGSKDGVLGYELINEPWAGDIYRHPNYVLPGEAGKYNLQPVYDYLEGEINKVDSKTIIFFEPVTWAIYVSGKGAAGLGFEHVPGGAGNKKKSALSYHYYCWLLQSKNESSKYPFWEHIVCDEVFLKRMFETVKKDGSYLGGARMLTEFGLCAPDNKSQTINTVECTKVLSNADANLESWTYWDSIFFDTNGEVNWPTVLAFSRPYPLATAGQPLQLDFNITSGDFHYKYNLDKSSEKPTEIFLPLTTHYSSGYNVKIDPMLKHTVNNSVLYVYPDPGHYDILTVTVTVTKKSE